VKKEAQEDLSKVFVETVTERIGRSVLASTIRPATKEDVEKARALKAKGQCPHNVIVDQAGWPYDLRSCYVCGEGLGTV
jgi:hypothetical protein